MATRRKSTSTPQKPTTKRRRKSATLARARQLQALHDRLGAQILALHDALSTATAARAKASELIATVNRALDGAQ